MKRLFVRPELCTGCKTCELACAIEHSRSKNLLGAMLEIPAPHPRLYVEASLSSYFEVFKIPMTCRHCDPAPCISACIPQAMHRAAFNDMVTNVGGKHACIACGMCVMMCPFGMIARAPSPEGTVMALKCDLCYPRPVPACAEACPTGAIVYMEADAFAHQSRQHASAVLSQAHTTRETSMSQRMEE